VPKVLWLRVLPTQLTTALYAGLQPDNELYPIGSDMGRVAFVQSRESRFDLPPPAYDGRAYCSHTKATRPDGWKISEPVIRASAAHVKSGRSGSVSIDF